MAWKTGDTALCVNAQPYPPAVLKEGQHYPVLSIEGSCCVTRIVTKSSDVFSAYCMFCHKPCYGFTAKRFIKIAGLELEQVKVLEKETA